MKRAIITGLLLLAPILIVAHSYGVTFEREAGQYFIDVGFADTSLKADVPTYFSFFIFYNETPLARPVDITGVGVTFKKDEETILEDTIQVSPVEFAGNTYTMPSTGTYDMTVQFLSGSTVLTEQVFPVEVVSKPGILWQTGGIVYVWGAAMLVLVLSGHAIVVAWQKKRAQNR